MFFRRAPKRDEDEGEGQVTLEEAQAQVESLREALAEARRNPARGASQAGAPGASVAPPRSREGEGRRAMKIPYGISDFSQIREEGFFYADKTTFLPVLEVGYRHLVFLRPRRFGKSTLVSMLEHYYDLGRAERFDELFRGLWVHAHPTPERGNTWCSRSTRRSRPAPGRARWRGCSSPACRR